MKNTQLSTEATGLSPDALAALLDGGYLRIYGGAQPANANTAVSTQNLLVSLQFSNPAAGPADPDGVLTFNQIAGDDDTGSGIPTWFRCLKSDGVSVVMDGSIGLSDANLVINTLYIQELGSLSIQSFTHNGLPASPQETNARGLSKFDTMEDPANQVDIEADTRSVSIGSDIRDFDA